MPISIIGIPHHASPKRNKLRKGGKEPPARTLWLPDSCGSRVHVATDAFVRRAQAKPSDPGNTHDPNCNSGLCLRLCSCHSLLRPRIKQYSRRTPHVTSDPHPPRLLSQSGRYRGGTLAPFVSSHHHCHLLSLFRRCRMAGCFSLFLRLHCRSPNVEARDRCATPSRQRLHTRPREAHGSAGRTRHGNIHRQAR